MRGLAITAAAVVWILSWLLAPASWWLNERALDEQWFAGAMTRVLEIDDVDREITDRATAQVLDSTRDYLSRYVPFLASQTDALLDMAQPTVTAVVGGAVNSQPGQKATLALTVEVHNAFLGWLDHDTLGRPGLEADLASGHARFDLDDLLAGHTVNLGPVEIPLGALDLPGLTVPVPLPPDWLRTPINLTRAAFWPAVIGIAASAAALLVLDRRRPRALGIACAVTALGCGASALLLQSTWAVSGADSADWTLTRFLAEMLIRPLLTAYFWSFMAMTLSAVGTLWWHRRRLVPGRPSA